MKHLQDEKVEFRIYNFEFIISNLPDVRYIPNVSNCGVLVVKTQKDEKKL